MTGEQWAEASNRVVEVLALVYGERRTSFEAEANRRGCSLEALAAGAVTGMLAEYLHGIGALREARPERPTRNARSGERAPGPVSPKKGQVSAGCPRPSFLTGALAALAGWLGGSRKPAGAAPAPAETGSARPTSSLASHSYDNSSWRTFCGP